LLLDSFLCIFVPDSSHMFHKDLRILLSVSLLFVSLSVFAPIETTAGDVIIKKKMPSLEMWYEDDTIVVEGIHKRKRYGPVYSDSYLRFLGSITTKLGSLLENL